MEFFYTFLYIIDGVLDGYSSTVLRACTRLLAGSMAGSMAGMGRDCISDWFRYLGLIFTVWAGHFYGSLLCILNSMLSTFSYSNIVVCKTVESWKGVGPRRPCMCTDHIT